MRRLRLLDSVILKVFWMFASRPQFPKLVKTLGESTPYCPGLGFTSMYTALTSFGLFGSIGNEPGVPTGTLLPNARRVQPLAFDANAKPLLSTWATVLGSPHCGSGTLTKVPRAPGTLFP